MIQTSYDGQIESSVVINILKRLTNQTFRLLPANEEGEDWTKPLETIIIEFSGLSTLLPSNEKLFELVSKLEGLRNQGLDIEFMWFRRIIFECCSMIQSIERDFE